MCPVKQGHLPQRPTWQCWGNTDVLSGFSPFSLFNAFALTKVPRHEKRNELSIIRERSALNFKGLIPPSLFHACFHTILAFLNSLAIPPRLTIPGPSFSIYSKHPERTVEGTVWRWRSPVCHSSG